jgi:3-oxoacyl-[acyl-carrier protein] reductase
MHKALVTGGSKGIGLSIAHSILADGGHVMITGRDRTRLDAAVAELVASAGDPARVAGAAVDVRDRSAVDALVADTAERFGGLDTLINNAGVGAFSEIASMTDEDWDRTIATNLTGVFYCTRAALPQLRRAGGGWIINIASLAGRNYFAGGGAYCASKAGLIAFSEALMLEVRYDDIRVSVIMPGSVATEFSGRTPGSGEDWKLSPDDVAEVVMDLIKHPERSLPSRVEIRPSKPKKA